MIAALHRTSAETDGYFFGLVVCVTIGTILTDASYAASLPRLMADGSAATRFRATRTTLGVAGVVFLAFVVILAVTSPVQSAVWWTLSPLIVVLGVTGVYAAVLVCQQRYALASMRVPMATALAAVVFAMLSLVSRSILLAAVSVTIAQFVILAVLVFAARRLQPEAAGELAADLGRSDMLRPLTAAAVGLAAAGPLVVLAERAFASMLQEGSVTLLAYARGLALLPLLASAALANGVYLKTVEGIHVADAHRVRRLVLRGVRLALATAAVMAGLVIVCKQEVVRLTLERGEFGPDQAAETARLVGILAVSVVGLSVSLVLTRVLFAFGRQRAVTMIGLGTVLAYCAIGPALAVTAGTSGLAAAFSILSSVAGLITAAVVVAELGLRLEDVTHNWLVVPAALAAPFLVGALGAHTLIPAASSFGGAALTLFTSLAVGVLFLGAALVVFRPAEYALLRRSIAGPAGEVPDATPRPRR